MRSMTGYGRHAVRQDGREVAVELKSVNHRYLDISFRLPREMQYLEADMRSQITGALSRGRVDVVLTYANQRGDARQVSADMALAQAYHKAFKRLKKELSLSGGLRFADLAAVPGVLTMTQAAEDEEAVSALVHQALSGALEALAASREREGSAMQADMLTMSEQLERIHQDIAALAPEQPARYAQRLTERLRQLRPEETDPQRLAQEVALFADRCAVDEELARLRAHLDSLRDLLHDPQPAGRRLDFLVQEMNREVNTIGSKASELAITQLVLDAKSVLEKVREQLQNIE
ncbi:MAG: YicC family protein [Clostridiales bacterium]|nr:YicC family protein [Clostridiales bacterium]